MDKFHKKTLKALGIALLMAYGATKPAFDFYLGADSPVSRYITKPLHSLISNNLCDTEEQYQKFLDGMRHQIANGGNIRWATIFAFPFAPNYSKYEDKTGASKRIYELQATLTKLGRENTLESLIENPSLHQQIERIIAERDSLKATVDFFNTNMEDKKILF